jgi:hypothetical protein
MGCDILRKDPQVPRVLLAGSAGRLLPEGEISVPRGRPIGHNPLNVFRQMEGAPERTTMCPQWVEIGRENYASISRRCRLRRVGIMSGSFPSGSNSSSSIRRQPSRPSRSKGRKLVL